MGREGDSTRSDERIALYMRVSSEEQAERMTIGTQEDFLEQYRGLYGHEVTGIYKDEAISGTVPLRQRPGGRRMLENAKEGTFDVVLVYKLDRIGRTLLNVVDAHDRLDASGVALRHGAHRHLQPLGAPHLPHARLLRRVRARNHPREDKARIAQGLQ